MLVTKIIINTINITINYAVRRQEFFTRAASLTPSVRIVNSINLLPKSLMNRIPVEQLFNYARSRELGIISGTILVYFGVSFWQFVSL